MHHFILTTKCESKVAGLAELVSYGTKCVQYKNYELEVNCQLQTSQCYVNWSTCKNDYKYCSLNLF